MANPKCFRKEEEGEYVMRAKYLVRPCYFNAFKIKMWSFVVSVIMNINDTKTLTTGIYGHEIILADVLFSLLVQPNQHYCIFL